VWRTDRQTHGHRTTAKAALCRTSRGYRLSQDYFEERQCLETRHHFIDSMRAEIFSVLTTQQTTASSLQWRIVQQLFVLTCSSQTLDTSTWFFSSWTPSNSKILKMQLSYNSYYDTIRYYTIRANSATPMDWTCRKNGHQPSAQDDLLRPVAARGVLTRRTSKTIQGRAQG